MKNILFVLYEDFYCNSALHVHHFANNLVSLGLDCVVSVPRNKLSVSAVTENSANLYKVTQFNELYKLNEFFTNQKGPDIIHAWTPRELPRIYCNKVKKIFKSKLIIHLEDNEEHILERYLNRPFKELLLETKPFSLPDYISHPTNYREFLKSADGVTVIIERLKEFVPPNIPSLILWPGVDTKYFFPRKPNREIAERFNVPKDSLIFCYTGNVHAANTYEVRSLYLAVAVLNREGKKAVLIRTGQDMCNFLGSNLGSDDRWAREYAIELGHIPRKLIPEVLSLASVLIQPGRPDPFNDYRFPSKLPEFLAMGKPTILPATNIGLKMEHKKDALVLPIVDATAIVDAVEMLERDSLLKESLSEGSHNFAIKNLDWYKNSQSLKSFYESRF